MPETLFKSEKYPWFKGFDLSEAALDTGRFVFKDQVGVDLILGNIIKAYAIQKDMTVDQFTAYLKENNYKIPVLNFETDGSMK